jgi:hypothetical protein
MAEKEAKMLEEMENMRKKNEELEKEKIAKEFQNKKWVEKSQHPYIASKIEACENEEELKLLYKFTDFDKEKAMYEADNTTTGSVTKIPGAKSKEEVKQTNPVEAINANTRKIEEELLKKRQMQSNARY